MVVIGLMSGTSLDGVDAVLAQFTTATPTLLAQYHLPFSATMQQQLWQLQSPSTDELHLSQLAANQLARCYADTVHGLLDSSGYRATDVAAIGCHGQTIRHRPECNYTVQIGNAALLAELTGINVISDFRSRDVAAGGQGAPLVPAFHAARFAHATLARAIVNIGGISNITYLSAQAHTVLGFDCGPGNVLMDFWIKQQCGDSYDRDGQWATRGHCIPELLSTFLAEPFFQRAPPKSTGRELFNPTWLAQRLQPYLGYRAEDIQATLLALTARSIANAIGTYPDIQEIYLCGGGAYNKALIVQLAALLPDCIVADTTALGVAPAMVEAFAFAWLAQQTLQHKPGNLPAVTGADGPRILGSITFA